MVCQAGGACCQFPTAGGIFVKISCHCGTTAPSLPLSVPGHPACFEEKTVKIRVVLLFAPFSPFNPHFRLKGNFMSALLGYAGLARITWPWYCQSPVMSIVCVLLTIFIAGFISKSMCPEMDSPCASLCDLYFHGLPECEPKFIIFYCGLL